MNDTEKKEKIEYIDIPFILFPDFDGDRIDRDFYLGKGRAEKIRFGLPVPRTDEESQQFYGCPLSVLIEKGVKQASYDKDSGARKLLADNPEAEVEAIGQKFQEDLPALPTKRERRSEDKKLAGAVKAAAKATGLTTEEILAKLRAMS